MGSAIGVCLLTDSDGEGFGRLRGVWEIVYREVSLRYQYSRTGFLWCNGIVAVSRVIICEGL